MPNSSIFADEITRLLGHWCGIHPDPTGALSDGEIDAAQRALGVALPGSFRVFLRLFGGRALHGHRFLGLPRCGLRGDIVLLNRPRTSTRPRRYIRFTDNLVGEDYYLDTSRRDAVGECPVVVVGGGRGVVVAHSFMEFLRFMACRNSALPAEPA